MTLFAHRPVSATEPATVVIDLPDATTVLPFDDIFDPAKPVEVDIGCGHGRFLLAQAAAHPERQFLGIDRMSRRIRTLDRKILRSGQINIRLLRLEAFDGLRFLLPPHRVSVFHIYFPDPWPKRRHHRRRLFSRDFPGLLWSCLLLGGIVQVATDHLDYFASIRKLLAADPRFCEVPHTPRNTALQTDFELLFRGRGVPVGECAFKTVPAPKQNGIKSVD